MTECGGRRVKEDKREVVQEVENEVKREERIWVRK